MLPAPARPPWRAACSGSSGREHQHLPAGHYEVVAWTKEGSIGVVPDVLLAPCAHVRFGDWDDPALDVHGFEVFAGARLSSTGDPVLVPPGLVRLRAWHERLDGARETVVELERTLAVGEEWLVAPP